jgi:hypothetical protein
MRISQRGVDHVKAFVPVSARMRESESRGAVEKFAICAVAGEKPMHRTVLLTGHRPARAADGAPAVPAQVPTDIHYR